MVLDKTLFIRAQEEIFNLMLSDSFFRFRTSPEYLKARNTQDYHHSSKQSFRHVEIRNDVEFRFQDQISPAIWKS
jgi:hypothetical protein